VPVAHAHDHLGWHEQDDGNLFLGLFVDCGRVRDDEERQLRTAVREVVRRAAPGVHLTTQQNLLLVGIPPRQRAEVEQVLSDHGVAIAPPQSGVLRWGMACPALPTCGLAVAESERVFPSVVAALDAELDAVGLAGQPIVTRMTGCPNGCARPYNAEIAFVGRSLGKYVVYVGGNAEGTRLARKIADLVPLDQLAATVRPLFQRYAAERLDGERFGDFYHRVAPVEDAVEVAR
jgi:sulfite reductase (ferredoxin)